MEEKINIAEILKDKPKGIRLYSPIFGECSFQRIQNETDEICVKKHNNLMDLFSSKGLYNILGECLLFPSKEMRDWNKFAWKKGDVLVNSRGLKILFDRWANDNYTSFYAKTINLVEDAFLDTNLHTLASEKEAKSFIKCIEEKLGGKLNLETLEIEKQPEFKDGDILSNPSTALSKNHIFIFSKFNKYKDFEYHVALTASGEIAISTSHGVWCRKDSDVKYATEEEKQQLFSALEKEGKAWDAEKKMIVDLKPKIELKPFDKVLVRNNEYQNWRVNLFGFIDDNGYYNCAYSKWAQCIPYEGNEQLLGTTKDV